MSDLHPGHLTHLPREGESFMGPRAKADYVIDLVTGCWEWQKFKLNGYGTSGKHGRVHRVYYRLAYGDDALPATHDLHHKCENPGCINPEHMEPVTRVEHLRAHKRAKSPLTIEQVIEIRSSTRSMPQLATEYGVPETTIWDIRRGKNWKGIGPDRPVVHCRECGELITTGNRDRIYCSALHRQRFNQRKAREAKRAEAC